MEEIKLKRRQWEKFLKKEHLAVSKNSADGNCFFESISEMLYGHKQHHGMARKKNCNWVKTRIEYLKVKPIARIPPNECKTIEELLDQLLSLNIDRRDEKIDTVEMCKNYTYAGLHQILATCIIYKEQKLIIQVFHEFANDVTRTTYSTLSKEEVEEEIKEGRANIIYLHYSLMEYSGGHYQAIVDADEAIKEIQTQTQETLDEFLHQFPQVNPGVITQLHELGYQIKDIKKVFEEGDVLGKDIGYIMDKISTMQKESSPKGSTPPSSQSRSNSPNNKTSKASTTITAAMAAAAASSNTHRFNFSTIQKKSSAKDTRKASTVRSNSPKDTIKASSQYGFNFTRNDPEQTPTSSKKGHTPPVIIDRKASPPPTSSTSAKDPFDDPFYDTTLPETPAFGPIYTQKDISDMVNLVKKVAKEQKKNKGGNKTKKRGRRYRSFRRT